MAQDTNVEAEVVVYTIRLTINGEVAEYDVCQGVLDPGVRCWLWRKVLPSVVDSVKQTPYAVVLDSEFGSSCTCKGHLYSGHCKHQEASRALTLAGRLPELHPPPPPARVEVVPCPQCHGSGAPETIWSDSDCCSRCGGEGSIVVEGPHT